MNDSEGKLLEVDSIIQSSLFKNGITLYCTEIEGDEVTFNSNIFGDLNITFTQKQLDESKWIVIDHKPGHIRR